MFFIQLWKPSFPNTKNRLRPYTEDIVYNYKVLSQKSDYTNVFSECFIFKSAFFLLKLLEAKMKPIKSVMADLMLRKGEFNLFYGVNIADGRRIEWLRCDNLPHIV